MNSIIAIPPLLLVLSILVPIRGRAQTDEVIQLLLNVEKLSQLKGILSDMKRGYEIISGGYNAVRSIAKGNFSLHETFIDGLMLVNPEIRKYHRIADIIRAQKDIVQEYRTAFERFRRSGNFTEEEIAYLGRVYGQLFEASLQNLDELLMVTTSSQLRMSDDDRLRAIDRIFADMEDKLQFLRHFNREGSLMGLQREKEKKETETMNEIYGTN
ncbi:TerB family tellurite resistance protein [Parapedobacter sp. DT-150]|uniref:TerB family tellurite resistance protein n=1 Tax=Parapedobacter sp. DT-150 TaxID=3396162 RepID=UPI003F1A2D53